MHPGSNDMKEIKEKSDVDKLVTLFYETALVDPMLAPFFKGMDFEAHKPRMIHFWSFVLIDEPGYKTNVTEKHMHMPLKSEHFDRWIFLFKETVDEHFEGEIAERAKHRAELVGWTILSKLEKYGPEA